MADKFQTNETNTQEELKFVLLDDREVDYKVPHQITSYVAKNVVTWNTQLENANFDSKAEALEANLQPELAIEDAVAIYFASAQLKLLRELYNDETSVANLPIKAYMAIQQAISKQEEVFETIRTRSQTNPYYRRYTSSVDSLFNQIYTEIPNTTGSADTYYRAALHLSAGVSLLNK